MSVDFTAPGGPTTDSEGSMFAPIPAWERGGKKRRSTPVRRTDTAASVAATDVAPAGAVAAEDDLAYDGMTTTRIARTAPARRGAPTGAIVGGLAVLAALGAAGWYASQPHDNGGVAQLTPGAPTPAASQLALNTGAGGSVTPTRAPQLPISTPAASATQHVTTTTRATTTVAAPRAASTRVATARARPAASASDVGVDASAVTTPAAPIPYGGTTQGPAVAPSMTSPAPSTMSPMTSANPGTANPAPTAPAATPGPSAAPAAPAESSTAPSTAVP